MENMLESFIDYNPVKKTYKDKKTNVVLYAIEFYKGRREILIAFEESIFPLPKPYVFGKTEWKEKYIDNEKYMPKTFKLNFLQEYNQTPLSEKESKLLNRDFGYKNIGELALVFNNAKTDEELDKLFDKIVNKLNLLKKLINTVSNITEKRRINNVIKSVEFVLNHFASNNNVSYGDSEQDISDFDSSEGSGLKILTPNQMLSKVPITLAQLKAENNSEKLKNEIRQLLHSLYKSKNIKKQLYKSLIGII